jgi:hypothetical protein
MTTTQPPAPEQPQRVTLRDWAARIHRAPGTVQRVYTRAHGFPRAVGRRPRPGGTAGRGEDEYLLAELDRWWARKQAASRQAGGPPPAPSDLDPDARVNLREIAERLGITHGTVRRYPALYARGDNPFPTQGEDGRRRWGDVLAWHRRRRGSGPPGRRTWASRPPTSDTGATPGA